MTDINRVFIVGRLTRDSDLKYTNSGTPVCKFSVACNRSVKHGDKWQDEASFFDVTAWSKLGENLSKYLVKGKQVAVEGHLQQSRWEKDGATHSKVEIVADSIQLLGGDKPKDTGNAGQTFESDSIPF